MNKVEFLKQMCNFLNNTRGDITKQELSYIVHYYDNRLDCDCYLDRFITDIDVANVSCFVENDDENRFLIAIKDIADRIKRNVLEDVLYDIGRLCSSDNYNAIKEIIEKEFN